MGTGSIRNKLFLLLFVMGAIPMLIVISIAGVRTFSNLEQAAMSDNWLRNSMVEEHVTELFMRNFYVLRALAVNPVVQEQLRSPSEEHLAPASFCIMETNRVFHDTNLMALTGTDGMQMYRTDGAPCVDLTKRKHFQEAMRGREYVSDVILSMATGELIVVMEVPVKDERSQPIGMVQRNIHLSLLQDFVKGQADSNTTVIIVDREGRIIAHSERKNLIDGAGELDALYRSVEKTLGGVYGVTRANLDGQDSMVSYSRNAMTGWAVITVRPYRSMLDRVYREAATSVAVGLMILFAIAVAAYLLSVKATRPIRELARVAERIASGKGSVGNVPISTDDELGQMAAAFNEISASRDAYQREAELDNLTRLSNKTAIEAFCSRKLREFVEAEGTKGFMALYVIDLDHFKEANDTFGHQYGDHVLMEFAKELKRIFRPTDCVGRFGGDEFVVIIDRLPGIGIIVKKAETINQIARDLVVDGRKANITASIGIAIVPEHGMDYETLFHSADKALYHVKHSGRDHYCYGPPETSGEASHEPGETDE